VRLDTIDTGEEAKSRHVGKPVLTEPPREGFPDRDISHALRSPPDCVPPRGFSPSWKNVAALADDFVGREERAEEQKDGIKYQGKCWRGGILAACTITVTPKPGQIDIRRQTRRRVYQAQQQVWKGQGRRRRRREKTSDSNESMRKDGKQFPVRDRETGSGGSLCREGYQ